MVATIKAIQIDRLQERDAEEISLLETALFPDNCLNERTLGLEILNGEGWGIRDDGKLVAYLFGRHDGNLFDILRLGVATSHRRRGLGQMLLTKALSSVGHTMLTVKKSNKVALDLYASNGFLITGELDRESWVMELPTSSESL